MRYQFILFAMFASSGVLAQTPITRAAVEAGGITPNDRPGYPVVISLAGKYQLVEDLIVPAGVRAIEIVSPGVTLDLNGFQIKGPVTCETWGSCVGGGTAAGRVGGVWVLSRFATVLNGRITGFDGHGVWVQADGSAKLRGLYIDQNYGNGVQAEAGYFSGGPGTFISETTITQNNGYAVDGLGQTLMVGVTAVKNRNGFRWRANASLPYGTPHLASRVTASAQGSCDATAPGTTVLDSSYVFTPCTGFAYKVVSTGTNLVNDQKF